MSGGMDNGHDGPYGFSRGYVPDAQERIASLSADNERLRAALRPFTIAPTRADYENAPEKGRHWRCWVTAEEIEVARNALSPTAGREVVCVNDGTKGGGATSTRCESSGETTAEYSAAPVEQSAGATPPPVVRVPRETLEWIGAAAAKHGRTQIAFVCDKLLKGEGFSPLRDHAPDDV
jgi:hypothetical protein